MSNETTPERSPWSSSAIPEWTRAPLWSRRILIAAKGVADHIVPWSHGGPSHIDNLVNVCAACNYSRGTVLHDTVRAAAYRG